MVPNFENHPIVQEHGASRCSPQGLFVDAVEITEAGDSMIVWIGGCVYSQKRDIYTLIRKSQLCTCGCRGLHTLLPIDQTLANDYSALERGIYATSAELGQPFVLPRDSERCARAGKASLDGIRLLLIEYRADLLQLVDGLGLPSYRHTGSRCCCLCDGEGLKSLLNLRKRHALRTQDDYDQMLKFAEFDVLVDGDDFLDITNHLGTHKDSARAQNASYKSYV